MDTALRNVDSFALEMVLMMIVVEIVTHPLLQSNDLLKDIFSNNAIKVSKTQSKYTYRQGESPLEMLVKMEVEFVHVTFRDQLKG